jgi:hypothetical protein
MLFLGKVPGSRLIMLLPFFLSQRAERQYTTKYCGYVYMLLFVVINIFLVGIKLKVKLHYQPVTLSSYLHSIVPKVSF